MTRSERGGNGGNGVGVRSVCGFKGPTKLPTVSPYAFMTTHAYSRPSHQKGPHAATPRNGPATRP